MDRSVSPVIIRFVTDRQSSRLSSRSSFVTSCAAMEATLDFLNNNNNNAFHNRKDVTRLKSSLTLDVDCGRSTGNGLDLSFSGRLEDGVLSTPDVGLLKLATPELERLVLHQYLQQQQQDQTAARRPEPLSHSIDGRSLFPVVAADEVGTSTAVEVRRSADQHFSAAEAHSSASRHGRHIVGSLSEFDARSAVDTFAATSSSSSSAVCSSAVQQQQQQQQQCHVIDAPVNSWNRDFYTLTSLSSSSSSMFPQLSDRAKFTQYAPLMVPQFSPSSSAAAASPTPPLPNPGQQQQQRKKNGGERRRSICDFNACLDMQRVLDRRLRVAAVGIETRVLPEV